ncbi:putative membrane protein [Aureimonas phyllosphaerae]|uniref:Putative membrane protein n=1 Tax=Aureimonas phyllosphaerae TaxID=1166078 RepID=A0A7W6BMU7_9HYPH|nr:putative membrane protein [Aureimonas phyllosphaerae]MBB3957902.1 putative membrane protein [Aureimonas phyllosphaerae]
MIEAPRPRRSLLWLVIGAIAVVGIVGNVAIAVWLLAGSV